MDGHCDQIVSVLPRPVRRQLGRFVDVVEKNISSGLVGIYVHGSLAFGCFNPKGSDIDIIVVTEPRLPPRTKCQFTKAMLSLSSSPVPLEVTILRSRELENWAHPCSFELHFGEKKRALLEQEIRAGKWRQWNDEVQTYEYLAAHVSNARERGFALAGISPKSALPEVPRADLEDFIRGHLFWSAARVGDFPLYALLTSCRAFAFLSAGLNLSKQEACVWAMQQVPDRFHTAINKGLRIYRGTDSSALGSAIVRPLVNHILTAVTSHDETACAREPGGSQCVSSPLSF